MSNNLGVHLEESYKLISEKVKILERDYQKDKNDPVKGPKALNKLNEAIGEHRKMRKIVRKARLMKIFKWGRK